MNGIIGMVDLLLATELTEEQKGFVQTVKSSGKALIFIINDILDFSKIEAGKLELEKHPFQLSCLRGRHADFDGAAGGGPFD